MAFTGLTFPANVPQCGTVQLSWSTSGFGTLYPARVELYYQQGNGPWETTGSVQDVYSSPYEFTINVPSGMTVWPTIVGNNGAYAQINVGSAVTTSNDASCLTIAGTPSVQITETAPLISTQTIQVTDLQTVTEQMTKTVYATVVESGESHANADPELPSLIGVTSKASSSSMALAGTNTAAFGSFQPQELNSGYKTATSILGAFFGLSCLIIAFLLFVLCSRRRRQNAPLRPRLARFTDDGSFMSERSSTTAPATLASGTALASSNPFSDPEEVITPTVMRSSTFRSQLGFSHERRLSAQTPGPVSELFLAVPPRPAAMSGNNSDNELSRIGTINSIDDRQGLQGLYVRNHSQFTLQSTNTDRSQ